MSTRQETTAPPVAATERAERGRPGRLPALAAHGELIGYVVVFVALAVFLWTRIGDVDQFYLDEWTYAEGAQWIWDNLPGGLVGAIPGWDRGPQRLHTTLMAPLWGLFGTSTAFTLGHLLNVLLLSSAVVPAALFARRVIDSPALRVLGVALGVAVPWLAIGAHMLAENLAFPLYLWAIYAIVLAAEAPSLRRQLVALALIAATTLCRLSLASIVAVLLVAVLAAEIRHRLDHRDEPFGTWLRAALRREWPVVATAVVVVIGIIAFLAGASSSLGRYGAVDGEVLMDRLFGDEAHSTRRIALTYGRSLAVGTFVMPFVIGLAVALAGSAGRLGRRMLVPSVAALTGLVATLVAVAAYTITNLPEERYVFAICAPLGVLAAAGLERLDALRRWLVAAAAVTLWLFVAGLAFPAISGANFFAAPAGATWTRVFEHRLKQLEGDLLGWAFIPATGWLLIMVTIAALVLWIGIARSRPRLRTGVVAAGLCACLAAQVAMLGYAFKQELYGTTNMPGGIALGDDRAQDREQWVDAALPDGAAAAVVPGLTTITPLGYAEALTFWSKDITTTVAMPWNGAPVPLAPGQAVAPTALGPDGLAVWEGAPPAWLVAQQDDPRVQFAGEVRGRRPTGLFQALELTGAPQAAWTGTGVDAAGGVAAGRPATLTLDRAQRPDVRSVELTLASPAGGAGPARYRVTQDGRTVARGRVEPGATGTATLRVPACETGDACPPYAWELRASGAGALRLDAARLGA